MNDNFKKPSTFTVYALLHNDFVKMCNDNGMTASQVVSNFEYMYVTNHALIQSQIADVEFCKGAKSYGR